MYMASDQKSFFLLVWYHLVACELHWVYYSGWWQTYYCVMLLNRSGSFGLRVTAGRMVLLGDWILHS